MLVEQHLSSYDRTAFLIPMDDQHHRSGTSGSIFNLLDAVVGAEINSASFLYVQTNWVLQSILARYDI